MIDRIFIAALSFCLLAGGTLAMLSALFEGRPAARSAEQQVVQLPAVEVRLVQLPRVKVSGKRVEPATAVARTDNTEPASRNMQ